ncbi:MAG: hypothetical protein NC228_03620 [[Eubacterium] siraeum]|nr:hypothetical protein [[Eubacterium] siraeum]
MHFYCVYTPLTALNGSAFSGGITVLMLLCFAAALASVMLNLLLLNRIREFKTEQSDENFAAAKKMQTLAGACGAAGFLILVIIINLMRGYYLEFNGYTLFCVAVCFASVLFNAGCLQKYNGIKRIHNADVMKRAKGDPSVVFSEDMELSAEEKNIVSQIALNAGVNPQQGCKSDEELFAVIDDPIYAPLEERGERICPFCGKSNRKKYTVCAYCGQPLPAYDTDNSNQNT